jgi:hypothetical protein
MRHRMTNTLLLALLHETQIKRPYPMSDLSQVFLAGRYPVGLMRYLRAIWCKIYLIKRAFPHSRSFNLHLTVASQRPQNQLVLRGLMWLIVISMKEYSLLPPKSFEKNRPNARLSPWSISAHILHLTKKPHLLRMPKKFTFAFKSLSFL